MRRQTVVALLFLAAAFAVTAGAASRDAEPLRVGTSGDYPPFSRAVGEEVVEFEGFDIELARAYAVARGRAIEFVPFRWPELTAAEATQLMAFLYFIDYLGRPGSAAAGASTFDEQGCSVCHEVGGGRADVGPDLASVRLFASPLGRPCPSPSGFRPASS